VLGSGTTASTLTSTGLNQWLLLNNTAASNGYVFRTARQGSTLGIYHTATYVGLGTVSNHPLDFLTFDGSTQMRLTTTGNLLIGTTTDMTGSGGLKIAGTTAATTTTSGALIVAGGVGVSGAGYFGGGLNVTGAATFAGAVSASGDITRNSSANSSDGFAVSNTSTGTAGAASISLKNSSGASGQTTISQSSTGLTPYGAWIANSGVVYNNSGRLTLMADGASGSIHFATGGNTSVFNIASTGAATFAGAVTSAGLIKSTRSGAPGLQVEQADPNISLSSTTATTGREYLLQTVGADGRFRIYQNNGTAGEKFSLAADTGAATFAGAVTVAGTVIHTLSATPASASATGTVGTMSWDANYIYSCTAANTWKRVAIATW